MFDVIVVGAGVVGPAIATAMARQGRKVLIVERDWTKPDRIVGELMQPAGIQALRELGMARAINKIEAIDVVGYYIKFLDNEILLDYPTKHDAMSARPDTPVPDCVNHQNDEITSDSTLDATAWHKDNRVRGVSFHHGDFIQNLRSITKAETNVTAVEGTVVDLIDEDGAVTGVVVKSGKKNRTYRAKLTICCDGIYSRFRKRLYDTAPLVGSYSVGPNPVDAELPAKNRGHVILGSHAPILVYQILPHDTRILCLYRSRKPPSQANGELLGYLQNEVLPALPEPIRPSFKKALTTGKFRSMPNQYLSATRQGRHKGLVLLGDAANMRHPLTGGGMTVGLNDAALFARLVHPNNVPDLDDHRAVAAALSKFHNQRKGLDAVINTLSIALYTLFAADSRPLQILQLGCFKYFQLGGACVSEPIGLLSGVLPQPLLLFRHFFTVAFYAVYWNFLDRGLVGAPLALYEAVATIFTAVMVFLPYLWKELV